MLILAGSLAVGIISCGARRSYGGPAGRNSRASLPAHQELATRSVRSGAR